MIITYDPIEGMAVSDELAEGFVLACERDNTDITTSSLTVLLAARALLTEDKVSHLQIMHDGICHHVCRLDGLPNPPLDIADPYSELCSRLINIRLNAR
jgi:hypothetical protein